MPEDTRPTDPVLGVPINPDGTRDLSNGLPPSNLAAYQAELLASIPVAEERLASEAKRTELIRDLKLASGGLAMAVAAATAFGLVPPLAVPFAALSVKFTGELIDAIEKASQ